MPAPSGARELQFSAAEFERLRMLVHRLTGIALADSKRELLYTRMVRRIRARGLNSFSAYCQLLESGAPAIVDELANAITTNLTAFFRENHHFLQLAEEALPELCRMRESTRRLRFWSAGCSTGEEPYSLAMTLRECLPELGTWNARILATDIAPEVLQTAQVGSYSRERLRDVPGWRRDRWFTASDTRGAEWTAAQALRDLIVFKQLNLLEPWRMRGPFDVIFCRNVIIYFDKATQRELFARMAALQEPGSWLFIGHSENLSTLSQCYRLVGRSAYRRI